MNIRLARPVLSPADMAQGAGTEATTTQASAPSAPAPTTAAPAQPSAAPAPAPAPAASPAPTTTAPATSPGDGPTDLLSAVRAVLKPAEDDPASAGSNTTQGGTPDAAQGSETPAGDTDASTPSTEGADTQAAPADASDPADEITAADLADIQKPSVRKRMEKLLEQRATLRSEVENLRPQADNWQRHVEYLSGNGVRPEDAQLLYGVGAMLARGDFSGFLDAVMPYVEAAQQAAGVRLPPDLQRKVDDGMLTQEDAGELARARAAAANAEHRVAVVESTVAQTRQTQHVSAVRSALTEWEQGVSSRDPDYAKKKEAVARFSRSIVAERGLPPDARTAVVWANEALAEVNKLFGVARPQPQATAPRPSSVQPATPARPEPKNMLEAVQHALNSSRAA